MARPDTTQDTRRLEIHGTTAIGTVGPAPRSGAPVRVLDDLSGRAAAALAASRD